MKRTEMENKITELSEEQMNAGQGGGLFDIIRDSIGNVLGSVTEHWSGYNDTVMKLQTQASRQSGLLHSLTVLI